MPPTSLFDALAAGYWSGSGMWAPLFSFFGITDPWPLFSPIMRPPSYRQRLFVEHDLGESSGSTVDVAPTWVSMA